MNKTNTSFTLRGLPENLGKNISEIAALEKKSRNQLIIDTLTKEFGNPIRTYERRSQLVKVIDNEISNKLNCELIESRHEGNHPIYPEKTLADLLDITDESDVDEIFKSNISLIEFRAKQLEFGSIYTRYTTGLSLTFSLFIEIAKREPKKIEEIKKELFHSNPERFTDHINKIRKELNLKELPST